MRGRMGWGGVGTGGWGGEGWGGRVVAYGGMGWRGVGRGGVGWGWGETCCHAFRHSYPLGQREHLVT